MTQTEKVHEYMKKNGTITSMDAIQKLRITRLAARISDLKDSGVVINTKTIYKKSEDGAYHYTEYSLG